MTGDACVQKVKGALKGVAGVTTQSVKVGAATIGADPAGCTAACNAINGAGFKAHAEADSKEVNGSDSSADQKVGGQIRTPSQKATGNANLGSAKLAETKS